MRKFKTCSRCGRQFDENLTQCPHCREDTNGKNPIKQSAFARIGFAVLLAVVVFGLLFKAFDEEILLNKGGEGQLQAQTVFKENFDNMTVVNWSVYDLNTKKPVFDLLNVQNGMIALPSAGNNTAYGLTAKPFEVPEGYEMLLIRKSLIKAAASYGGRLTLLASDKADYSLARPVFSIVYRTGKADADGFTEGFYISEYDQRDYKMTVAANTRTAPVKDKAFAERVVYEPKAGKLEWYLDEKGFGGDTNKCDKRYFFVQMTTESSQDQGEMQVDDFEIDLMPKENL
jgi:hypothetical protein